MNERIAYNVFNGTDTREGWLDVDTLDISTNDLRRMIAEQEDMNLNGLVVDRTDDKVVIRSEAIFG